MTVVFYRKYALEKELREHDALTRFRSKEQEISAAASQVPIHNID